MASYLHWLGVNRLTGRTVLQAGQQVHGHDHVGPDTVLRLAARGDADPGRGAAPGTLRDHDAGPFAGIGWHPHADVTRRALVRAVEHVRGGRRDRVIRADSVLDRQPEVLRPRLPDLARAVGAPRVDLAGRLVVLVELAAAHRVIAGNAHDENLHRLGV